jgi:UDP-N-acetylmuramoyl-tripeptide--D-alanyl-D-alanine ligase
MRWADDVVRSALGLAARETGAPERPGEPTGAEAVGEVGVVAYTGIGTDTRRLQPGMLFVALRGERFDGHDFLGDAAARGAAGAVVDHVPAGAPSALVYYRVGDTLEALGRLARYRRRRLSARVCAITGTNGKTTTKELSRAVLATRYRTHATLGNLNNLVGTPLTLLGAPDGTEALVVEVGTNAPGEIARLRDLVEPEVAIITNVAEGHLEGLGTLAGVLREKTSLLEGMGEQGLAVVGDTPPELPARAREICSHVRVAGPSERADRDLRVEDVRLDAEARPWFHWHGRAVHLAYRGRHNATNAMLALALGEAWGVDPDAAVAALATLPPQNLRAELLQYGTVRVLADCYNANPVSFDAALELLLALPRGSGRVVVVGTMLELGAEAAAMHRRVAQRLATSPVELIVATGEFVPAFEGLAVEPGRLILEPDPVAAFGRLADRLEGGEIVLLKASHGTALERLLPHFARRFGPQAAAGEVG